MSYPATRYTGDDGDISATFRPASTPPELTLPSGDTYRYLATGRDSEGDFGLYEVNLGPGGGTGTHFHRTFSESFYLLSGTLRVFDGEFWRDANVGDYLYVPAGGLHSFRNESDSPITMLMLFTPGAPREGYFEGISGLGELTDAERADFFTEHDNFFVDPAKGPSTGNRDTN